MIENAIQCAIKNDDKIVYFLNTSSPLKCTLLHISQPCHPWFWRAFCVFPWQRRATFCITRVASRCRAKCMCIRLFRLRRVMHSERLFWLWAQKCDSSTVCFRSLTRLCQMWRAVSFCNYAFGRLQLFLLNYIIWYSWKTCIV